MSPPTTPSTELLEEEELAYYKPDSFYPVQIGDILHSRYQVLFKIGFGSTSTVWICRDTHHQRYVCAKAMIHDLPTVTRELNAYQALSDVPEHRGKQFVRTVLDHFELQHGDNNYHFLIHEALGLSMGSVLQLSNGQCAIGSMPGAIRDILRAVEFVHSVNIVHTDIQPGNLMFTIGDQIVFREMEKKEIENPSRRKIGASGTVYESRNMEGYATDSLGETSRLVLCDFGEARMGKKFYSGPIQPLGYKSPEVLLHVGWKAPVDIWNIGCMLWHFATGGQIFMPDYFDTMAGDDQEKRDGIQLATMAALLGPPPKNLLRPSGDYAFKFFNPDRTPKYQVPSQTFESRLSDAFKDSASDSVRPTNDEANTFIAFLRKIFHWHPSDRPSASQLLEDAWIFT